MINYRLLVVDDDNIIHKLYADVAQNVGYDVKAVKGLHSIRTEYHQFKPTLIFLDLALNEGDGIEVLRFLSEAECKCPIVVISSHDAKVRATTMRLGESRGLKMDGTFQKPVDVLTLTGVLENHKHIDTQISSDDVANAIKNREIILHFQPKIEIATQKIMGVEALARWMHPSKRLLYPEAFIPFVERTGQIRELSRYVIELAMQQIHENNINLEISINLSARDLVDLGLPDEISQFAKKYNINPAKVCFEITETAVMSQPKMAMDILTRLRILGFTLSMDDFGTGYSSLVELHRLPFNELKIDKSFIVNLNANSDELPIVQSVIDLGKNLKLHTIAEGVETKEAWDILKQAGCDYAQGFLISHPMEMSKLKQFIKLDKIEFNVKH
ncbi:MAG: EAL domain-containing response regulator [Proteobacteria bacterium]|nr:EAL domain-containing response regulator [Pseudomonadota bacterium]